MRSLAFVIPNLLVAAVAASSLLLASCSTTPTDEGQKPAPTEERKPAAGTGAEGSRVAPIDLTKQQQGSGLSPLKDPNNILSKRSIFYDFDKFDVRDEYRGLVEAHAKYLRDNPGAKMLIQGNTDERGSREYNVGLGQRRSDGVKKLMILLGAKESQIESVSLGEEKPRDPGHSEQAWAQNRRSDILYGGEY
ncbi:MAG TPA: peptidoglycan-associated lipoprotein Pal [Burkholderiales bacterium]|jgi:peptidoglycan-associated lipoprotein